MSRPGGSKTDCGSAELEDVADELGGGPALSRRPATSHTDDNPTTSDTDDNIVDAIAAGAAGFLLKDTDGGALRNAVRIAASGEACCPRPSPPGLLLRLGDDRRRTQGRPTTSGC